MNNMREKQQMSTPISTVTQGIQKKIQSLSLIEVW